MSDSATGYNSHLINGSVTVSSAAHSSLGEDTVIAPAAPFAFTAPLPSAQAATSSPSPYQNISPEASVLKFKEGDYIFREGETPKGIYQLKSGAVKVVTFRPLTRGRVSSSEFINKLVGPKEFFGFKPALLGQNYSFYARVLVPSEVTVFPIAETFSSPTLNKDLVMQMSRDIETHERNAQLHYLASVQERIAFQLALLAEKFGVAKDGGISINLRLTRNELAQLAGTINESLSRHLTEFKTLGLLDVRGKEIIVKNLPELKVLSGNFK
jgi:CRP-like cAMP-binding protein